MKKKLLLLLALILCFSMIFVLASCGEDDKTTNNSPNSSIGGGSNNGGSNGGSNSGGSNNGGNNNGGNNGGSNGGSNSGTSSLGTPVSIPDLDYTFDINYEDIDSVAFKVTNASFEVSEDSMITVSGSEEYFYTEDLFKATVTIGEGYIALDENNKLEGYGRGVVNITGTETNLETTYEAGFYIEDNYLYVCYGGNESPSSTELIGSEAYKVSLDSILEFSELEASMGSAAADIEEFLPKLDSWMNDVLLPIIESVDLDNDVANELIGKYVQAYKNSDGSYTFAYNYEYAKELIEATRNTKVSELIDMCLVDDTFDTIKELISSEAIYELTMVDAINYIETDMGLDLKATLEAIDALLVLVTDDETMTLAKAINEYYHTDFEEDFDFYEFALNNKYSSKTVMDAIMSGVGDDVTEDQVKTMILGYVSQCESKTIYDFLPMDEEEAPTVDEIIDLYLKALDNAKQMQSSITFDKDGAFKYVTIGSGYMHNSKLNVLDPRLLGTATIVIDKDLNATGTISSDIFDGYAKIEIIPNETVNTNVAWANALKAKVDNVPVLTHEQILSMLLDGSSYFAYYDEYENCYYVIYHSSVYMLTPNVCAWGVSENCSTYYTNGFTARCVSYYNISNIRFNDAKAAQEYVARIDFSDASVDIYTIEFTYDNGVAYYSNGVNSHSYDESNVESTYDNIDCGELYTKTYHCLDCDYSYTSYNTKSHVLDYSNSESNYNEVLCGETYYTRYSCSLCNEIIEYESTKQHSYFGRESNYDEVSCGEKYYVRYTCSNCNEILDEYEDTKSHSTSYESNYDEVLCGETYYSQYTCTQCNKITEKYENIKNHDFNSLSFETNYDFVSCGETYYISYPCTMCSETKKEEFTKSHAYDYSNSESNYDEVSCGSIYYTTYNCPCKGTSKIYSVKPHSYDNSVKKLAHPNNGINGGIVSKYVCNCGKENKNSICEVSVNSAIGGELYTMDNNYFAFSVTINEETAGEYYFYSSRYYPDGLVCLLDSNGEIMTTIASDYSGFNIYVNLEAGQTYVFASSLEYDDYSICLERN